VPPDVKLAAFFRAYICLEVNMDIPNMPFRIVTRHKVAGVMREEFRNATNLAEAYAKFDAELKKGGKRTVRIDMTIAEAQRGGGE
jgi:hypothetical protein